MYSPYRITLILFDGVPNVIRPAFASGVRIDSPVAALFLMTMPFEFVGAVTAPGEPRLLVILENTPVLGVVAPIAVLSIFPPVMAAVVATPETAFNPA